MLIKKISSVTICLLLLLLSVWQCKKDTPITTNNYFDCRQIDTTCPSSPSSSIFYGPIQNCSPFFNPNNSNEFLYIENDTLGNSAIVIYNLLSKQKKQVIKQNHVPFHNVNWSSSNWIIFIDYTDHQICIIRPDGSDFRKLTHSSGMFSYPVSNNDFDEILASYTNFSSMSYMVKMDIDGNIYDSILNKGYLMGCLSKCYKLACLDNSTPLLSAITVRDTGHIKSFVYIPSEDFNRNSSLTSLSWHPNCEDIYFTNTYIDIYKVNIYSYKQNIVKMGCFLDRYGIISISPDGNKILAEKEHHYFDTRCHEYYNTDLFIMNIDGSNELKVFQ